MASSSQSGSVIYCLNQSNSDDPNINRLVKERINELLNKFKDSQGIIYLNIENVVIGNSRSRSRSRGNSRSRSRSSSHSPHRHGKKHHNHHLKGHRPRPHFGDRNRNYPHHTPHHYFGHHLPHHYYTSQAEETNCEVTTGPETNEECNHVEICCRKRPRGHHKRHRRHSRSRSRGRRSRSKSKSKKTEKCSSNNKTTQVVEIEDDSLIEQDDTNKSNNPEGDLERRFDSMNVSPT